MYPATALRSRILSLFLTVAILAVLTPFSQPAPNMAAAVEAEAVAPLVITPQAERISGADRFETNAQLVAEAWDRSEYVIIANGYSFADAIVAGPLAGSYDAPLLLSEPNRLSSTTAAEIRRLQATKAIIVGGESVLSAGVIEGLVGAGIAPSDITRLAGTDRYDTARVVSEFILLHDGNEDWVVMASGLNFPDALSISPWASRMGIPILLTRPAALPDATKEALRRLRPDATLVVGGTAAVSDGIMRELPDAVRIAGANRYATSAMIAEFSASYGMSYDDVCIAKGTDFPDALSAGPVAGRLNQLVILTHPDETPPEITDFFMSHCSGIDEHHGIHVIGGTAAIDDELVAELVSASETILNGKLLPIEGTLASLVTSVTANTVVFDNSAGGADEVTVGDIILAGPIDAAESGFLREVMSVTENAGELTAVTTDADLGDVIIKGSIDISEIAPPDVLDRGDEDHGGFDPYQTGDVAAPAAVALANMRAGVSPQASAHFGYKQSFTKNLYTGDHTSVDVNTDVGVDVWVHVNVSWSWGSIRSAEMYFMLQETLSVEALATLHAAMDTGDKALSKPFKIGSYTAIDLYVAKISADVYVEPMAGFKASIDGTASTGFDQSAWFKMGFGYNSDKGMYPISSGGATFQWKPLTVTGEGKAKAWIGPRIWIKFCGSSNGLYVQPNGFLEADAKLSTTNLSGGIDYKLDAGAEYKIGGHIDVLGFKKDPVYGPKEMWRTTLIRGHIPIN